MSRTKRNTKVRQQESGNLTSCQHIWFHRQFVDLSRLLPGIKIDVQWKCLFSFFPHRVWWLAQIYHPMEKMKKKVLSRAFNPWEESKISCYKLIHEAASAKPGKAATTSVLTTSYSLPRVRTVARIYKDSQIRDRWPLNTDIREIPQDKHLRNCQPRTNKCTFVRHP